MERVVQFLKEARQSMLDAYPSLTMEKQKAEEKVSE